MKARKALLAIALLIVVSVAFVFADGLFDESQSSGAIRYSFSSQLGLPQTSTSLPANAVLLAIGNSEYPVTPGDSFVLNYSDGRSLVTQNLQADSDCKVSIMSVGVVDAAGMTYRQFKAHVENLIATYYAYSMPQVQLLSCGVFSVKVSGEVSYSQFVTAWGLSRLSDLAAYAGQFASTREVEVTYSDGSKKTYDLFAALRDGSSEDNPLLAPGCEVRFLKAKTIVSLDGAVHREGIYQLCEGETLYDLIQNYGCGIMNYADAQSIKVSNYSEGSFIARYLTLEDAKTYMPANGDVVSVMHSSQNLPYVTIVGAITPSAGSDSLTTANRTTYSFLQGETLEQLLSNISSMLLSTSDVSRAYILREGSRLKKTDSMELVLGDTIVIPFSHQTVTVTGYVMRPGTFEYVPGMTTDYYIGLAGGFTGSASGRVKVVGPDGGSVSGTEVPAGATITAKNNNLTTNIALTASILAILTAVLDILIDTHTITTWF